MYRNTIAMLFRISTPVLLIILQFISSFNSAIVPPRRAFNLSHYLYPKVSTFVESSIPPEPPRFLQGVLSAIANKEKWALEDIRVSRLDAKKAKYRTVERYDFRIRVGKIEMALNMYEEVSAWNKLVSVSRNDSSDFEDLARKIGSKALIDSVIIEGPIELRVDGDDDRLTLTLPLNTSYSGLRRISVGEGITVELKGAEELSLLHSSDNHQSPFGGFTDGKGNKLGSIWPGSCKAPMPVRITGSASVFAHRKQRPDAVIHTAFSSSNAVKLLPEKCYVRPSHNKPRHPLGSLLSRITLMERVLRNILSKRGKGNAAFQSLKMSAMASYMFQFQLELERDIRRNDSRWSTLAEWRTKPSVEYSWFEVSARIEGEVLKPLVVKRIRPFITTDSLAWSSLLSNISFTQFPSILLPSEALTLDVKW